MRAFHRLVISMGFSLCIPRRSVFGTAVGNMSGAMVTVVRLLPRIGHVTSDIIISLSLHSCVLENQPTYICALRALMHGVQVIKTNLLKWCNIYVIDHRSVSRLKWVNVNDGGCCYFLL